jgi:hypothetical protein
MSLSESAHDRRRSPRLNRVVKIVANKGEHVVPLLTSVISAQGALVHSPETFMQGTDLALLNPATKAKVRAWVVRAGPAEVQGQFVLALEFLEPAEGFWGVEYRVWAQGTR